MPSPAMVHLARAVPIVFSLLGLGCGAPNGAEGQSPRPWGHAAQGGSLIIDRDRMAAYAADADNKAIHRVDLLNLSVVTSPLDGEPEQIVQIDGDRLAVTLRDKNRVELLEIDAEGLARPVASADVPLDPFGIALSPQGDLLVTSGWANKVTALDEDTLAVRWSIDVAREPRGITVAPGGEKAFVTHVDGDSISLLDITSDEPPVPRRARALGGLYRNRVDHAVGAGTLHPTASLAYTAVISESGERLFLPHVIEQNNASTTRVIPGAYGGVPFEEETSFASVAVMKAREERVLGDVTGFGAPPQAIEKATPIAADPAIGFAVAPEPAGARQARAAAILGDRLFVASLGTNELYELDARAIDPAMSPRNRYSVGEGPTGVAVEPLTRIAVVWSQLSHEVTIVSIDSGAIERVSLAGDPLPPDVAEGRRLFFSETDRRISHDGRACASCHPEGRDDGLVWALGAGPRQTPTLVGRLARGPYGWLGKHPTLEGNIRETIMRLGGTGLSERELSTLAAFLQKGLRGPDRSGQERGRGRNEGEPIARGRSIFMSEQVGCSGCHHLDTEASDRARHDVGSRGRLDSDGSFRTPPLLYIAKTAPYFHDGRYATLEQLINDNLDRMGQTTHLSPEDVRDLVAFLRTL
jgi:DNA-binding beta-propeller fold protein YncE